MTAAGEQASDVRGRLDVLAYRMLERKVQSHPLLAQVWEHGLNDIAEYLLGELLPDTSVLPKPKRRLRQ